MVRKACSHGLLSSDSPTLAVRVSLHLRVQGEPLSRGRLISCFQGWGDERGSGVLLSQEDTLFLKKL